jgi:hypothetical protein
MFVEQAGNVGERALDILRGTRFGSVDRDVKVFRLAHPAILGKLTWLRLTILSRGNAHILFRNAFAEPHYDVDSLPPLAATLQFSRLPTLAWERDYPGNRH